MKKKLKLIYVSLMKKLARWLFEDDPVQLREELDHWNELKRKIENKK